MKVKASTVLHTIRDIQQHNALRFYPAYRGSTGDRYFAIEGNEKVLAEFEATLAMRHVIAQEGNGQWDVDGTEYLTAYVDLVETRYPHGVFYGEATWVYEGLEIEGELPEN